MSSTRLPLSAAQSGVWLAHELDASRRRHNTGDYLVIDGPVDPAVFAEAWQVLAAETDVHRAGAVRSRDGLWLDVREAAELRHEFLDVSALADPDGEAVRRMRGVLARPCDVGSDPLSGSLLFKAAEDRFLWFQWGHHVVHDGYSAGLCGRRLASVYSALADGEPVGDSGFGTFADLLRDEDRYRESPDWTRDREYWLSALADVPSPPRLGGTRLGDAADVAFLRSSGGIDAAGLDRLRTAARASGTLWTVWVTAAFGAYLNRMTGQDDLLLTVPVTGRTTPAALSTPGMMSNQVPLRFPVEPGAGVGAIVPAVTEAMRGALRHQRYRYEDMCRDLGVTTGSLLAPMINIMPFGGDLSFGGHTARLRNLSHGLIEDLAVAIYPEGAGGGLRFDFSASPESYGQADVDAHQRRFVQFLEEVAADPSRPIAGVDLMLPGERHQVVTQWNDTERAEPPVDVVAAVAAQVATRPEATAVVFQGRKVTYHELNARANRIAHHLIAEGAGPETFVALAIPPSADLVAAVLAVLKTGAAYLPLDPVYPQSRIDAVLADARPVTVLREVPDLTGQPETDPVVDAAPGNQAYMIYTSGSTGRPKGVVVPRSALSNFLAALGEMELVGPDDRVLSIARAAFDIATLELLLPLVSGAAVVVAGLPAIADPEALIRLVLDERVTVMQATPSRWQSLLGTGSGWMAGLRVLTGGEELPAELAAALRSGAREVVNLYGPTETTIYCTGNRLERPIVVRPSVGAPFRDSRAYVLDDDLTPLPPGAVGEIYMAGACLSRGYHDRPGLTADRYLPDPFSAPGERMYRTGDRGRFLADGTLECLGRTDFQVKVRGHRVELGEIEANLTALPRVSHAVTLVRDGELVSYVVGQRPDPEALRARLADVLPAFMVPSAIVVLDALPLTANGKLDRAALPAPDRTALVTATRTARTPEERVLCELFAEVLGLPEVGVDDAFFRLGGQSLLAVRLISRIRTVLGAELSVRDLYDAPTAAELALRLDRSAEPRPPLRRAELLPDPLPLSFAQRRLWFLNRLEGAGASYNITTSARISGLLDVPALRLALADVVARHDSLRTVFPEVDGVPRQLVLDPRPNLLNLPTDDVAEADLPARLREHGHRGFDLTTDLPFRVGLFRVGGEHVLVTTMHHIAVDNGSIRPLAADLITAYLARSRGRAPEWDEPAVRYADYTLWQRELLGDPADPGSRSARQLGHWRTALAGLPERIELPADRRPSATPAHRGGVVPVELDAGLHRALAELAGSAGVSLFMVLRAAFATVLSRAGAGDDVPIGTPNAGRTDEALDGVAGMFVNPLVLRTDLSGDPVFTELLRRVRDADLAAHANQDLPFEQIVDAVAPSRSTAHHPLFQVMMPFRAADDTEWEVPGLAVDVAFVELGVAQFDLQLSLGERASGGITGHLEYSADLFEVDTAERVAGWFRHLLEAVAADPDRPLSALPMVGDGELAEVVGRWNETARELPEQSLSELVEAQAERSPGAVAVLGDDVIWTYEELNARANQLARVLREDGVGLGSVVGVRMERSPELVLAALAVLKAGGAYLPLDPALPAERLDFMIADAGARQVITRETVHSGRNRPAADLGLRAGLDAPAYVTYTSGTTGGPKGVLCTHRGVVNRVRWTTRAYLHYRQDDRVLVKVPIGFDVSVGEIFGPLTAGAGLVMARPGGEREPDYLRSMITDHGVTQAYFVPSMLSVMLAEGGFTGCHSLRLVLSGGEELSADLAARVLAALPGCELVNQYGPTEAALDATAWRVSDPGALSRIPIAGIDGQVGVQDNVTLYVLDDDLRPVPAGVPGQLHIGGMGLAYGYLGRPGLTAARFVPDPFGSPGGRLYRTGDRVRWTPRRTLEYLGRTDQQVKINGARIEPGEVQSALAAHPDVRQAVVTADGSRLLGYAVPVTGSPVDGEALREHLAVSLPEFMVPATITVLEALPLTANGKVDLAALPAVGRAPVRRAGRTPVEDLLCELYADVLGVPEVGTGDGFFALGGDSIMSIQLVSRARSHDIRFTPRDVFRHPTVEGLASVAESAGPVPVHTVDEAVGDVPHTPLSHALAVSGAPVDGFAQSVLVRVPPGLGRERLVAALGSVMDQHDMLRARLVPSDEGWQLRVRDRGAVDAEELVSSMGIDSDIEAEAAAQVRRLAPAEGKMLRVTWFDAGPDSPGRLLIVAHHLVVDGVSWRILLPDLAEAWRGGRPRPATTPFRVWSGKLAEAARQRGVECPHWEGVLAGPRASIATRPLTPADTGETARRMRATLPAAFHTGTEAVLLTALSLAVARCRGGATVVDLEGHGREEDADLSRTVGWFTTVHPVRLDPDGEDAVRALKQVKEALRNVPGDGRGYGLLRHLNSETSGRLAALPQPEILVNYLGRFDGAAGADWEPVLDEVELVQGPHVRAPLTHALTIDVHARAGVLDATWTWAGEAVAEADVVALAESWLDALRTLAGRTGHVPSDFPLVSLDQGQLDALEAAHPNLAEVLPLTSLQSGLLYYSVLDGEVDVYNGRLWLELDGALDAGALRSATHLAVNRHAALRAAFVHEGFEVPVQVVHAEVALPWEEADLSGLGPVEQEAETERLVLVQSRKFDLARPPLLRFLLIRLDESRHRFVVVNHHLVMDGWSLPVLLEEIFAVYAGVALPPPARYTAHLDWLAGHDHDRHRKAWAGALAGLAEPTLVAPGARDEDMTMPRRLTTELSREQTDELAALARAHSITTSTLIECAWAVLLSRLTGREDVVFGTTVSGRPPEIPGVERMVGMFVNTIPVRVRLGSDSVGELLHRVQEEQAGLTGHHHVGLDDIQRDAGLGPLFDTVTVLFNYPLDVTTLTRTEDLRVTGYWARDDTHFALRLAVLPGTRLRLNLDYRPDLFTEEEAQAHLDRVPTILAGFLADPGAAVATLDILTPAERQALLHAWSIGD